MSEPRWLEDDESAAWFALVSLIVRLPAVLDSQLRRDADLNHFEYQVLAILSMSPGHSLRMSRLADLTDGSLSRLSHTVRRLEERGWVQRTPDADDRRSVTATLTDEGMRKVEETAPGHVAEVRDRVFDPLTGEQVAQLREIATAIVSGIDPEWREPFPT